MSNTVQDQTPHRRPHPQAMAGAYLEFNLREEIEQLQREPEWTTGRNAKTLVKYDDFRVVLTVLRSNARMPSHRTDGRISIQTLEGHIQVRAAERTFDLPAGGLLTLDRGVPHEVEAREDSVLLLTIAWHTH